MSWRDRLIGIILGLIIGIVAVTVFVVYGSGETIDAPSLDTPDQGRQEQPAQPAP